nr:uncharacterized protein LOC107449093 [Parasteatoda tepidariorum]
MGGLLSARISHKIESVLELPLKRFYWTDSSIACYWIKGDPNRHKVFVKNGVQEIQKLSKPDQWHHCIGKDNPADLISRGASLNDLKINELRWHGPTWLTLNETEWPVSLEPVIQTDKNIDELEIKKSVTVNATVEKGPADDLIARYSSFSRLIRITALCLRFVHNCKMEPTLRKTECLSASELERATEILKEILRVGGRLKHSRLPEFQKHQILLPKNHHLTELIIDYFYKKSLHSGVQTTLNLIRQLYWITSGQNQVRRILNKCITCFRSKNQTINQMMGDLPRDRIVPSRPFERVGLDYAGPIITKPNLKRSEVTLKSYIAIFICFCTKATHFEVVSDLTTEAFMACLRRFISRRSKPSIIWSDNATNFKGAKNILNEWERICKSTTVQRFSAEESIQWNFIPPASPNFGGLWEANIKAMKRILLKVTKSAILNFEELTTLVTQIEAVLNSRPLSPLSSGPNDTNPLTWKLVQNLRNKFWSRWSSEYLQHLQTRAKWKVQNPNLKVNQLVLLKDPNTKPMYWSLGRIVNVLPGKDGLVRVVDFKTSTGVLRRAINKVAPLPIPDSPVDPGTF